MTSASIPIHLWRLTQTQIDLQPRIKRKSHFSLFLKIFLLQGELKREVSMLHKKFLMESHNAEVAKMKKNMQQMISASF